MESRHILVPIAMWTYCLALLTVSALVGCDRKENTTATLMNTEQIIRQHRYSPISDSIYPITKSLAEQSVFVGTDGVAST